MNKTKTYEELMQCVPADVQEEFHQIEQGKRLPDLGSDVVFKKVFDPDIHKERIEKLLTLIYQEEFEVGASFKQQIPKATVFSKDTIHDVVARLATGGMANLEMQVLAQEFIVERMDIYASDMILLQYAISEGEKKTDFSYIDVQHSYLVVFMKKSPKIFKDSPEFIHFKKSVTDTGIELNQLACIVYIELEKCLKYVKANGYDSENKELWKWLIMLADVNDDDVKQLAVEDPEKAEIIEELYGISKSKEELMMMLSEKYAEATRSSEIVYAKREAMREGRREGRREGEAIGIIHILKSMNQSNTEIIRQLMTQMQLSEKEADSYLKAVENNEI